MTKSRDNKRMGVSRIREDIAILYPPAEREKELYLFEKSRKSIVVKMMLLGIVMTAVVWGGSYVTGILEQGSSIRKNAYGLGSRKAELIAVTTYEGQERTENITVDIPEKQYTEEETEELFAAMLPELDKVILADNKSLHNVSTNLRLIKTLPGYPFQIKWETDQYDLIDASGSVNAELAGEGGELVQIKADISYGTFKKEYIFHARVVPKEKTAWELQKEKLLSALEKEKGDSQYADYFILPESVDGTQITWKEKKDNPALLIVLLFLMAGGAVYSGKRQELHKRVERRAQELVADYPEIVSKIVLLTGAGMTVRGAFSKIAADYKKKKEADGRCRYAYEEVVYTCHEMDTGIAEAQAYVNWGKRCREKQYIKLSMLLVQHLKKGSAGLIRSLQEEVSLAFAEKKAGARRAGEEAGTKLLLPMGLMLLVVMVLIIVPAFSSFG